MAWVLLSTILFFYNCVYFQTIFLCFFIGKSFGFDLALLREKKEAFFLSVRAPSDNGLKTTLDYELSLSAYHFVKSLVHFNLLIDI